MVARLCVPGRYSRHGEEARTNQTDDVDHLQDRRQTGVAWPVKASDERQAIEKGAKEFNASANRLIAVRWR